MESWKTLRHLGESMPNTENGGYLGESKPDAEDAENRCSGVISVRLCWGPRISAPGHLGVSNAEAENRCSVSHKVSRIALLATPILTTVRISATSCTTTLLSGTPMPATPGSAYPVLATPMSA